MDIAKGERVEAELDVLIDRQAEKNAGERAREQLWVESVRRHNARQFENHRIAWIEYRRLMRDLHWKLGDAHEAELQKLENGHREETT